MDARLCEHLITFAVMSNEPIDTPSIVWHTQEYDFVPKSRDWYWVVGIIAGGIIVAALLLNNILFALLIGIAAFTVMLFGARPPLPIRAELNTQGLLLNSEKYVFGSLQSFWIHETEPASIIFKSKKTLSPYIIVRLEYLDPENTRNFLLTYLPEEEHPIPFAELLSRRLGF